MGVWIEGCMGGWLSPFLMTEYLMKCKNNAIGGYLKSLVEGVIEDPSPNT